MPGTKTLDSSAAAIHASSKEKDLQAAREQSRVVVRGGAGGEEVGVGRCLGLQLVSSATGAHLQVLEGLADEIVQLVQK